MGSICFSASSATGGINNKASFQPLNEDKKIDDEIVPFGQGGKRVVEGVPTELAHVLNSPKLRHTFRVYLNSQYASESLMFYETVELYQQINIDNWRQRAAEGMVKKFVDPSSQYAVNISAKTREKLLNTKTFERDSFNEAKKELYNLMSLNFFGKFIASNFEGGSASLAEYYREIIKSGRPQRDSQGSNLELRLAV